MQCFLRQQSLEGFAGLSTNPGHPLPMNVILGGPSESLSAKLPRSEGDSLG